MRCIIVIDALRYEDSKLMRSIRELGLKEIKNHYSQCCLTEPSLVTILTGKYPQEHGVVAQAQGVTPDLPYFENSIAISPAGIIRKAFTRYVSGKYLDDVPSVNYLEKFDFVFIHLMEVHDMVYDDYAEDVGKKLKNMGIKLKAPNPSQKNEVLNDDERLRLYRSTVMVLDEKLKPIVEYFLHKEWEVIITADHGEEYEGGHGRLIEETLHVPLLIANIDVKISDYELTEHVDLLHGLKPKKYVFACQKHWGKQESISNGKYRVTIDYDRGVMYYVNINGRDVLCEKSSIHEVLEQELIKFSQSFKNNPIKIGKCRVEELKKDADTHFLKRWLREWKVI